MATLVLTTVGGAIGGPVGAMLGGLIGQSVDRELLKPKGREGPRLTELKLQTSSYGTPLPKLFGTLRVAGSVIWATDLVEHRHREGGKGRPTTTSYSYSASFAVALSARPILGVGRIWADGKLLRGAAGDWKAASEFRLHLGDEDQSADPLIVAAEGEAIAPAHRGIAYAVFEDLDLADFGNRIPSLTFEVVADPAEVGVGVIVAALSEGTVDPGDTKTVVTGFSAYGGSRRSVIEPVVEIAGAWPVLEGGRMTLNAGSGVATIVNDRGVRTAAGGSAGQRSIAASDRAPRRVTLSHYDPARDYQAGLQQATRPGAGSRVEAIELPAVLPAGQAKTLAQAVLARAEVERERRTVTTDWRALAILPGARIAIDGEAGTWRVAEWRLEAMAVSLDLVRIAPAALSVPATPGRVRGAPDLLAGQTILHAFELPHLGEDLLSAPRISIAACGTAPGWRRAALAISVDQGRQWDAIGSTALPANAGTIEQPAGFADAAIEDRVSEMIVELVHAQMQLHDADDAMLDRGGNLALAGDELIQFGDVQSLGGNRWRLTRLWRGRRGTEAAIGAMQAGDRFVLIERDALVQHELSAAGGDAVGVMAVSVNDPIGVETTAVRTNVSLTPPSPVQLQASIAADHGVTLTWIRRSRVGWAWIDGADAPLGEEAERYQVRIISADGGVEDLVRTTPSCLLDPALRAGGELAVHVRQIGNHGLSRPATIIIPAIEE